MGMSTILFYSTFIYRFQFRYPSNYINKQFYRFYSKYNSQCSSILPLIESEQFTNLRHTIRAQPSIKQIQINKSAANVDVILNQMDQTMVFQQTTTDSRYLPIKKQENKFKNNLFIHCLHEGRFHGLQRHIHDIYNSFYQNTPAGEIRLIVGHRNNPNLEYELSSKRPPTYILKNQPKQSNPC